MWVMEDRSLQVTIPADSRYVRVMRMVASRGAVAGGMRYDRIEDLALAMDEAAAELLEVDGGSALHGEVVAAGDRLSVRLWIDASTDRWPSPTWSGSLGEAVLASTSGEVTFEESDGRSGIRFTVR